MMGPLAWTIVRRSRTVKIVVRTPSQDPGTVLFGKTRRRVLGLLFGHPDESFFVRDIVRQSGAAQGAIARELDALLGAGLLMRREDGRQARLLPGQQARAGLPRDRAAGQEDDRAQ
jgi:DNA-binding transcriptional ArsR family regulator